MHKNVDKKQIRTLSNKSSRESISVPNKWLKSIWKDIKITILCLTLDLLYFKEKKIWKLWMICVFKTSSIYSFFLLLYLFLNHK